tara:strand:+ start:718 stop:1743 length:1026 start_codon:yes stop_codon:yes gene_type:complete
MAFWVVRAGKHGENESYALDNNLVAIGWEDLGDISLAPSREAIDELMQATYRDTPRTTTRIWTGEVWALKDRMQIGDLVCLPLKGRSALAVGRIDGPYRFDGSAPAEAKHQRPVKWMRTDLPRTDLDQDILFSLGSTLTVFQVKRNQAEERLARIVEGGAKKTLPAIPANQSSDVEPVDDQVPTNLEQFAADQIAAFIGRKFRGHDLSRLVAEVLIAEGYKVFVSPPGADGGVDILAGSGPMGFDAPKLAVQVKSSDTPCDVSVLRELQGVMPKFGADQGLIVSWGGYNRAVLKEARQLYFKIRLWDAGDVINAIKENHDNLSDEIQAELPLKRIWTLIND